MTAKTLNRRTFLRVSAAGGAFLVGGYLPGLREAGVAQAAGVFEPNVWVNLLEGTGLSSWAGSWLFSKMTATRETAVKSRPSM